MNKKEKALIDIFKEAMRATETESENSVWFFLGYVTSALANEAHNWKKNEGIRERYQKVDELTNKLRDITKKLR